MLKGRAFLTGDKEMVFRSTMDPLNKIINMDEDDNDPRLLNISVPGTYLLPPIEAKTAEIDGNEMKYDMIYNMHMMNQYSQNILAALIAYLYKGGNLLFYLPDCGDNTQRKFVFHLFGAYGIHLGILDANPNTNPTDREFFIDLAKIPLWLDLIFMDTNMITWREYLYNYPLKTQIHGEVLDRLLAEINPYGESSQERIEYIYKLVAKIKDKQNLICPLKLAND